MSSKNNPHGLKVGQEVWIAPSPHSRDDLRSEKILEVGRQYAYSDHEKIRLVDMIISNESNGTETQVYLSEQDYIDYLERKMAWRYLAKLIERTRDCPEYISLEMVHELTKKVRGER